MAKKESEVLEIVNQAEVVVRNLTYFPVEIAKLNDLKRKFTTTRENLEKAQAEYLTPAELKIIQTFKEKLRQIYHLENLQKELKRPNEWQIKNLEAYEEIKAAITQKILTLRKTLQPLEVQKIEEKLQKPCTYKNIALVAHQHFQANRKILEEMAKTSENILSQWRKMDEKSAVVIPEVFSISDLKDNLRQQYRSLKKQQETAEDRLAEMRQKTISPSRALLIAKNKFLKGDLKKLNVTKRKYEKAAKKLDVDFKFYEEEKFIFDNTKWENPAENFQKSYYLTKTKIELERRQEEIKKWKKNLAEEENRLKKHCASEDSKEKIGIIAASILRKNLPIAQNFEKEKEKFASIKQKLKLCRERLDFISDSKAKKKYFYRVIDKANLPRKTSEDQNAIISLIADALRGEKNAVPLVARSSGNNLEMEKTWELMSELDKDEFFHQKTFHNL